MANMRRNLNSGRPENISTINPHEETGTGGDKITDTDPVREHEKGNEAELFIPKKEEVFQREDPPSEIGRDPILSPVPSNTSIQNDFTVPGLDSETIFIACIIFFLLKEGCKDIFLLCTLGYLLIG